MKYFSLFSGVGGFEIGINNAYANSRLERERGASSSVSRGQEALNSSGVGNQLSGEQGNYGDNQSAQATCVGSNGNKPETPELHSIGNLGSNNSDSVQGASAGAVCIGFSEIDKHASAVLRYRFPNIKNHGDITKIDWSAVPDFDLLVGGSPCQSFSIAGKRKGLEGQSGLFMEYLRCLQEKKPEHFIWENVKGVLSSGSGADFAYILHSFSEAGYSLTWQVLNAKDFGVPQNRERVFVVGHLGGLTGREVFFERGDEQETADEAPILHQNQSGTVTPHSISVALGSNRSANYQTLRVKEATKQNWDSYEVQGRIRRLTPRECMRLMSWPDDHCDFGDYGDGIPKPISDSQKYKMAGNGVVSKVVEAIVREYLI